MDNIAPIVQHASVDYFTHIPSTLFSGACTKFVHFQLCKVTVVQDAVIICRNTGDYAVGLITCTIQFNNTTVLEAITTLFFYDFIGFPNNLLSIICYKTSV